MQTFLDILIMMTTACLGAAIGMFVVAFASALRRRPPVWTGTLFDATTIALMMGFVSSLMLGIASLLA